MNSSVLFALTTMNLNLTQETQKQHSPKTEETQDETKKNQALTFLEYIRLLNSNVKVKI